MTAALSSEAIVVQGRSPRILVGETYFQASRGVIVCVLDEERSAGRRTGCFVVEAERTRERWLAREEDLLDARAASQALDDARGESALRICPAAQGRAPA